MNFSEDEVRAVAGLANLKLTADEVTRLAHELSDVLTHIEQLNTVDTEGVEPMTQVLFAGDELATLREDVPHRSLSNEKALQNAPLSGAGYFKVPKVIDRS